MKTIAIERPNWDVCEVHCFADIHLGDLLCDGNLLNERIRHCEETENCVVILNGDLCNNAVKNGKSDVFSESIRPMEQLKRVTELFGKLAEQDKIIAITDGNHERRTYRDTGTDLTEVIATQLGIHDRYSPGAAFIFLRFGEFRQHGRHKVPLLYTILATHGGGGGSKIGGKANRLVSLPEIADADVFFHAHTHEPIIVKRGFLRASPANSSLTKVDRLFVNVGSYLGEYGGYAEIAGYTPTSTATPIVYLDGHRRFMYAKM